MASRSLVSCLYQWSHFLTEHLECCFVHSKIISELVRVFSVQFFKKCIVCASLFPSQQPRSSCPPSHPCTIRSLLLRIAMLIRHSDSNVFIICESWSHFFVLTRFPSNYLTKMTKKF